MGFRANDIVIYHLVFKFSLNENIFLISQEFMPTLRAFDVIFILTISIDDIILIIVLTLILIKTYL